MCHFLFNFASTCRYCFRFRSNHVCFILMFCHWTNMHAYVQHKLSLCNTGCLYRTSLCNCELRFNFNVFLFSVWVLLLFSCSGFLVYENWIFNFISSTYVSMDIFLFNFIFFVFNSFGEFWCWNQFLGKEMDPKFIEPPLTFPIE